MASYKNQAKSELDREDLDLKDDLPLIKNRHEKFFLRTLAVLPQVSHLQRMLFSILFQQPPTFTLFQACTAYESHRVSLVFFAVSGLDVLGGLDKHLPDEDKARIVEWIYRLQVPASQDPAKFRHGWRGGTFFPPVAEGGGGGPIDYMDGGHVTMTYSALATLLILGDDLSRVDRASVMEGLRQLQQPDGSFIADVEEERENDMRSAQRHCDNIF